MIQRVRWTEIASFHVIRRRPLQVDAGPGVNKASHPSIPSRAITTQEGIEQIKTNQPE